MAHDIPATTPDQIDEWIRRAYHPHNGLDALLSDLAASLMHGLPLRDLKLELHVDGPRILHVGRREGSIHMEWVLTSGPQAQEEAQAPTGNEAEPAQWLDRRDASHIVHAGQVLGSLSLRWQAGLSKAALSGDGLNHLCAWLGRLCHRYRVSSWSREAHRPSGLLIGASPSLARFECFIERAAQSDLAVLMRGEFGTEKAWAAAAIHLASRRCSGPFVEIHCAHPMDGPVAWLQRAHGGTLFLNGIDELTPSLQMGLLGHWMIAHRPSAGGQIEPGGAAGVRLVATTTADLRQPISTPLVAQALHAELDYLHAELPPLRTRAGDIRLLMDAALERLHQEEPPRYAAPLLQAFLTYAWPGNLSELERAMACLATLAEGPVISLEDAQQHTPWLVPPLEGRDHTEDGRPADSDSSAAAGPEAGAPGTATARLTSGSSGGPVASWPEVGPLRPLVPSTGSGPTAAPHTTAQWVGIVLERQPRALETLHPGLRRALLFLSDHFAEPVSLTELSAEAHVSASHLTYLFRSSLGMSFKSFLLSIRIHVAQELLRQPRLRITEVALQSGFVDLSHFERCFRRAVGRSAREHRRFLAGSG